MLYSTSKRAGWIRYVTAKGITQGWTSTETETVGGCTTVNAIGAETLPINKRVERLSPVHGNAVGSHELVHKYYSVHKV